MAPSISPLLDAAASKRRGVPSTPRDGSRRGRGFARDAAQFRLYFKA